MKILAIAAFAVSTALASDVTVTLTGTNGDILAGFDASPYSATIDGVSYTVWCDDLLDSVAIGDSWQATVGGTGKFPTGDYPTMFALVAEDTPALYSDVQAAIWTLTSGFAGDAISDALLAEAEAHPYTGDAFDVVKPLVGGPGQEFIVDAVKATPEGPSWMMAGIGCALVALRLLRKRTAA